jgi:hypothetical protein
LEKIIELFEAFFVVACFVVGFDLMMGDGKDTRQRTMRSSRRQVEVNDAKIS